MEKVSSAVLYDRWWGMMAPTDPLVRIASVTLLMKEQNSLQGRIKTFRFKNFFIISHLEGWFNRLIHQSLNNSTFYNINNMCSIHNICMRHGNTSSTSWGLIISPELCRVWGKGELSFTYWSSSITSGILIHWTNRIIIPLIIKDLSLISISSGTHIAGWELAWAVNPKYQVYSIQQCHIWQPGNENQLCYYTFNGDNQQGHRMPACTLVSCNQLLEFCMYDI